MPIAALIVVCPAIEVKAIKGHSLHADGKIGECGTDFPVEAVLIHAQVPRCIAQADESRRHGIRRRVSDLAIRRLSCGTALGAHDAASVTSVLNAVVPKDSFMTHSSTCHHATMLRGRSRSIRIGQQFIGIRRRQGGATTAVSACSAGLRTLKRERRLPGDQDWASLCVLDTGVRCAQVFRQPVNDVRSQPADAAAVISPLSRKPAQQYQAREYPTRAARETRHVVRA